ncbi:MAG: PEP-CTERM sorting domain-containing protein [Planctomycetota bacterium]
MNSKAILTPLFAIISLLACGVSASAYSVADTYWVSDNVGYVTVEGSTVYAPAGTDGLYVLDISDATDIQLLGHMKLSGGDLSHWTSVLNGDYLYTVDQNYGVRVFDVHAPANISLVGGWEYFDTPTQDKASLVLKDSYLYYTPWAAETQILDIGDVNNIQQVGTFRLRDYTYATEPGSVMMSYVSGDVMYTSFGYGGFHTIDVSNPTSPVYLDGVYQPEKSDVCRFVLRDGYAYLAGGDFGFHIIDVSDPSNISEIYSYEFTPGEDLNGSYSMVLGPKNESGLQYVFTWEGWNIGNQVMHVWDVTDPTNPVEIADYPRPSGYPIGAVSEYYEGYLVAGVSTGFVATYDVTEYHIPEPGTLLMASTGILGIVMAIRRRKRK